YRGAVQEVLFQLCGGLRASMGYCGTKDIKSLQKNSKFVQITNASFKENHPHSVILTKEAPNYSFQKK
ncbi:IMP dehydrogenase, partial [Mesomycoplasma ovipneumoniae]|uniref:IMP dehydrogenase n=1 Tax=Mesomycoplasma ovipneumoniae TaxID=29562 RepID=UPI003080DB1A